MEYERIGKRAFQLLGRLKIGSGAMTADLILINDILRPYFGATHCVERSPMTFMIQISGDLLIHNDST